MEQLETQDQKNILTILNFYRDVGVDLYFNLGEKESNKQEFKSPENIVKIEKNNSVNYLITNEEQKAFDKSKTAKNIRELEILFKNFDGCSLKKTATNFVGFQGNINSDILIVDGPPNTEEDKLGKSFILEKGRLFEKMLNAIELKIKDVFIVNGIPWRPPGNRYPTNEEIKTCRPFIFNLIKFLKPKIILCLGEVAANQVLNISKSIINLRGKWHTLKSNSVYNIDEMEFEINVLPTIGISHLLMRPDMKRESWEDLKLFRNKTKEILEK